jgi:hypothetical protein
MSFAAGLRRALDVRQSDVVAELDQGDSLEEVLSRHLLIVEEMCDDEILTSVLLLSEDGKHLLHGAAPSLPKAYCEAIHGLEIGPSAGSCGTAAYSGVPVYVTDIATDTRWAPYRDVALPYGLRSCWSTPIRHANGHVMGTFAIYHRTSCGPVRAELDAIEVITGNVAQAISWSRDPDGRMYAFNVLPKQVAALEAIVAAISQHSDALDSKGREAVDAMVKSSRMLANVVDRQLAVAAAPED